MSEKGGTALRPRTAITLVKITLRRIRRTKLAKPEKKENAELKAYVDQSYNALADAMKIKGKIVNYATVAKVEKEMLAGLPEGFADQKGAAKGFFHDMQERALREEVLGKGIRQDGRKFDESARSPSEHRPARVPVLALTRGETQARVTVTLGTADDQQKIEMVDGRTWKRFMLH